MINTDCLKAKYQFTKVKFQVSDKLWELVIRQVWNQVRYNGRWHQVEGRVRDRLFK